MDEQFPTPAVLINLDAVEENIKKMVAGAKAYNILHRPHIKSHKSVYLAKLQMELGACGITCAKLGEAEVMADGGVTDILIAYPLIGQDKMLRLERLCRKASITTMVNSVEGARQISAAGERMGRKIRTLIEIDGGIGRGGLKPMEPALAFARQIENLPGLAIEGLLYYGGTIYAEETLEGIERVTKREHDELTGTAKLLEEAGFSMRVLSGGSSFSSKLPALLEGITEVRAGHYIFNDCGQLFSGFAREEECALRVRSTVVSVVDHKHAILDAGTKSLTSDLCGRHAGFGFIAGRPDLCITKLNEEHAFVEAGTELGLEVGDQVEIIPNHACVVCNLVDQAYGVRGGKLERMLNIDARGKNQ